MGGHIDCYMDCSSFYSYVAFTYLLKNREALTSHDVTVNFIPVFLGGINHGSGNKPPWTLPAKGKYGRFDVERTKIYHGLTQLKTPDFFPPNTLLPQRALCYIKSTFSPSTFEKAWLQLLKNLWTPPQLNISNTEPLKQVLQSSTLFAPEEVEKIMTAAAEKEWKDKLLESTKKALDLGAFGAPWMWVKNNEGKEEPFFGSDRFHFMWEFLGIPWRDIEIVANEEERAKL